jgi:hypothetical protein
MSYFKELMGGICDHSSNVSVLYIKHVIPPMLTFKFLWHQQLIRMLWLWSLITAVILN